MIVMRFIIFGLCLMAVVMATPAQTLCQSDPYGIVDTVKIESKSVPLGGKFSVKVFLRNDEEITGLTIPIKYPVDLVEFDSVSFANHRLASWTTLRVSENKATSSVLFGGIAMNDPYLSAGYGVLAELYFHTASGAQTGQVAILDTAFFPPAGKFMMSSAQSTAIYPAFARSELTMGAANETPEFEPMAGKLINEGETLTFVVSASDPDGDPIRLYCGKLPPSAQFKDNGDGTGTFSWTVPYLGPGSSSGSPFSTSFIASDGAMAVQMEIPIEVINTNRPPQISVSGSVTGHSGDSVFIPLMASDPDLEAVSFSATNLPTGAQIVPGNPSYLVWSSSIADSGNHALDIVALDESGGTAHKEVAVHLSATIPVELSLTNEQAFSNEIVTIPINLHNRVDVAGFRLLIQFDPTLLTPLSFMRDSIRTKNWYPFSAQNLNDGRLIINAHADPAISGSIPLTPGDGAVAYLRFVTCTNPNFAGQFSRVEFKIIDSVEYSDNLIYLPNGSTLAHTQVEMTSGSVLIKKYNALLGDLNLNGVPMEIADAVYFTNYFLRPDSYPLNGVRWVNSDINQDGLPGTIGDLVYMLRILTGDVSKVVASDRQFSVASALEKVVDGLEYKLSGDAEIAAALITFKVRDGEEISCLPLGALAGMEFQSALEGGTLRLLIFSTQGHTFAAPAEGLFRLSGGQSLDLLSQEFVDAGGNPIVLKNGMGDGALPQLFSLEQNCPNPFNPETVIFYSLNKVDDVSLDVFNCLGQRVRTLAFGQQQTGKHSIVFDGKDDSGTPLASGIYLYRLLVGDQQQTRKMVLLK